jgi:hypothetical protein
VIATGLYNARAPLTIVENLALQAAPDERITGNQRYFIKASKGLAYIWQKKKSIGRGWSHI